MINYNNGKIYKLEPNYEYDEGDIFIGSTTVRLLCQRMSIHRYEYKKWKEGLLPKYRYFDIFDKYGIDNIKIVLLESVIAKNIDDLVFKECEYIKKMKCINKIIPYKTKINFRYNKVKTVSKDIIERNEKLKKEKLEKYVRLYREKNKEKIKQNNKKYRDKNKEKIKEKNKKYREEKKIKNKK
jgi:hypothetical protein